MKYLLANPSKMAHNPSAGRDSRLTTTDLKQPLKQGKAIIVKVKSGIVQSKQTILQ